MNTLENLQQTNQRLQSEIDELKNLCAEMYQVVGAIEGGDFEKAMDNLAAASNGEELPHETILPFPSLHMTRTRKGKLKERYATVTTNEEGTEVLAVTLQNKEGQIKAVLWEKPL